MISAEATRKHNERVAGGLVENSAVAELVRRIDAGEQLTLSPSMRIAIGLHRGQIAAKKAVEQGNR